MLSVGGSGGGRRLWRIWGFRRFWRVNGKQKPVESGVWVVSAEPTGCEIHNQDGTARQKSNGHERKHVINQESPGGIPEIGGTPEGTLGTGGIPKTGGTPKTGRTSKIGRTQTGGIPKIGRTRTGGTRTRGTRTGGT
ncbi:hypothetical protein V8G54_013142 [Vigna mungo]|uniref:Uncharacterized protein n=1 Tax=Vigna mungo TaxID=3915 RepID=A0AAQ3NV49_VIGMU